VRSGAKYVRHVGCERVYRLADMSYEGSGIDQFDKLLCEECKAADHGSGYGFVVVRPSVEQEFPWT